MKYPYNPGITVLFVILLLTINNRMTAQCSYGTPGLVAYDTTIAFPTGTTSIPVKFPQFDPLLGMVTCVRLCVTITGVIDSLAMQNFASSAQTGTFTYIRNDQITGPGFATPLSNTANLTYGPFGLTAYDGIPGAGTDFYSTAHDTILNEQLCRTLSDSTTIVQFYGTDSVTYNYDISVSTNAIITGGSSSALVLTSAFVNFHFEYCTCPGITLPANIYDFDLTKLNGKKIRLAWKEFSSADDYHYEIEMSHNGSAFSKVAVVSKNSNGNLNYSHLYDLPSEGRFFFRIRQVDHSGRFYLSPVKSVNSAGNFPIKFSLCPNPSNGIVGIKFDNIFAGKYLVLIHNTQGQTVAEKLIDASGNSYQQVGTLQRGVYWVRLTEVASQSSCVSQLLIK
jgi:hypothetical protein